MKWTPHGRLLHVLSMVAAGVRFAFALVRAVRTGYDLRYIWVALASLLGAAATVRIGRAYGRGPAALAAGAFIAATLLAVLAALLIGTILGPGIVVVGSGFGLCFAVGALLHMLART
jgi:hypothetical protein